MPLLIGDRAGQFENFKIQKKENYETLQISFNRFTRSGEFSICSTNAS